MCKYTVAMCNFNMADTVRQSLECILNQITPEFEVLVVDGGSTDGSVEILREMESEYEQLKLVECEFDPDRHLGADRPRLNAQMGSTSFIISIPMIYLRIL